MSCGVTYGPFTPRKNGSEYPDPSNMAQGFKMMAANGINAIRTYSVPIGYWIDLDQSKAYAYAKEVMSMNSLATDAQEGISAFLGKRQACWVGK